jgi:hypothetical protein
MKNAASAPHRPLGVRLHVHRGSLIALPEMLLWPTPNISNLRD